MILFRVIFGASLCHELNSGDQQSLGSACHLAEICIGHIRYVFLAEVTSGIEAASL